MGNIATGSLASVGTLTGPIDSSRSDSQVLKFIETTVSVDDQPIIYDELLLLTEAERENVLVLLPDRTLSNRPEFVQKRIDNEAVPFPSPPTCVISGNETCTGTFRQHQSTPGGSYFQANLTLSCSTTHLTPTPYEAAFMYASNYATDNSTDWEGGVEEDPPSGGPGNPPDIIPYIKEQGYVEDQLSSVGDPRLACVQPNPVILETYDRAEERF